MARKKLVRVPDLDKGKTRLSAIKSIDVALDLGNGINIAGYEIELNKFNETINKYNTTLSSIDDLYNAYEAQKIVVRDWNERILAGVATKYGKNTSQYEMAGGVKKSDRKKATPKKPV